MCDLMLALTIGSTLLGAAGQIQQGQAQAAASNYNAQVGDMNAKISERRERDAIDRGQQEEIKKRQEIATLQGRQRAAMAANGVDLSFGSPADTLIDTAVMGEIDALTIRSSAAREAYDYKVDAVNRRADANLNRMNAKSAVTGCYLAAGGTLLTGFGKAYGDYKQPKIGLVN